jgi:putative nucleotidyltransferase with HDIG domain
MRVLARRRIDPAESAAHLFSVSCAAIVYQATADVPWLPAFRAQTQLSIVGLLGALFALVAVETAIGSARRADREHIPIEPVVRGTLRATASLHLSVLSVAALLALAYPGLRFWAFPLILAPLAATQYAFRQFASIRTTYLQTIRALSKVPEMAGYSLEGHSRRVADLSVAVARDLGTSDQDVAEIEYAALLHDIGHLSVTDPADVERTDRRALATAGSAIVRETGYFPRVAEMIEQQYQAGRSRRDPLHRAVTIGARVITVTSAYDDLTRPGGVGLPPADALRRLRSENGEYDAIVVEALARVLARRGHVEPGSAEPRNALAG